MASGKSDELKGRVKEAAGAAGSIAMGLGGYLAARSDAEHYDAERVCEETEVREKGKVEAEEVADVFRAYGLTPAELQPVVDALRKRPEGWVFFRGQTDRLIPLYAASKSVPAIGTQVAA